MAQTLSRIRVVVLGASGMIGHRVFLHLRTLDAFTVIGFGGKNHFRGRLHRIDAFDEASLLPSLEAAKPDLIINCVGLLIADAARRPGRAAYLNGYLPHRLAEIASSMNARLIHISTDCVFSGSAQGGYTETSIPDGFDAYARSKALGEVIYAPHCTLRTSVVGPELKVTGSELFNWFMMQTGPIKGYESSIWSGVTSNVLAVAVEAACRQPISGLHHITNGNPISKYALLQLLKKYTGKDIHIEKVPGRITNKHFKNTRDALGLKIPSYDKMICEMASYIRANISLYPHYQNISE